MASGIFPLLNVSNLEKSVEFYKSLGLRARTGSAEGMAWGEVRSGDGMLILVWKDAPIPNQPADTRAWLSGELGKGVLVNIGVANIRKHWEMAQSARVTVDLPLSDMGMGGHEFWVVDPDGYVVCLADRFPGDEKPKRKAKARTAKAKPRAKAKARTAKGKARGAKAKSRR